MKRSIILMITGFCLLPVWVWGASEIYYVSESGSGKHNGLSYLNSLSAEDFNDPASWSSINNRSRIDPGDTVYVCGTVTTSLIVPLSGKKGKPITIRGDHADYPPGIIDCRNERPFALQIDDKDFIAVNNITLVNNSDDQSGLLYLSNGCTNITVDNVVFDIRLEGDQSCIRIEASDLTNTSDITISQCSFTGVGRGIVVLADKARDVKNITITDNVFHDMTPGQVKDVIYFYSAGTGKLHDYGYEGTYYNINILSNSFVNVNGNAVALIVSDWQPIELSARDKGIFPYNIVIDNNSFEMINTKAAISTSGFRDDFGQNFISNNTCVRACYGDKEPCNAFQLSNIHRTTIEYNTVSETGTAGHGDGTGIILDWAYKDDRWISSDNIVRYNVSHGNNARKSASASGIDVYKASDNIIYYNVTYNNDIGLKLSTSQSINNVFYNNVSYNNNMYGVACFTDVADKSAFYNNIIYHNGKSGFIQSGDIELRQFYEKPVEDYNCVYDNPKNYEWVFGGVWDPAENDVNDDPLFLDAKNYDFRLKNTSPCLDMGTDVGLSHDFAGNTVPDIFYGIPDIGVYEYTEDVFIDIKVNGADDTISVSRKHPVTIKMKLDPGSYYNGLSSDWWVIAYTPTGWQSYIDQRGWRSEINLFAQGIPLFAFSEPVEILYQPMRSGYYIFYFAVDDNADGVPDATWIDYVEVYVE